ncbi:MAG: thioredoxin family protein [Aequorivita sp.]|nr:thioredoxin family protein [Aequorivita sp.]
MLELMNPETIEVVHLGEDKSKITQAENAGVKSVPALVTPTGNVLHINYGASMADVKG